MLVSMLLRITFVLLCVMIVYNLPWGAIKVTYGSAYPFSSFGNKIFIIVIIIVIIFIIIIITN
jgi:hypothetical protein